MDKKILFFCANGNKEYCKKRTAPVVEEEVIKTPSGEGGGRKPR